MYIELRSLEKSDKRALKNCFWIHPEFPLNCKEDLETNLSVGPLTKIEFGSL
jgi:hypothetical protein